MSTQLNELKLQLERLDYDNKENLITIDILKEQNADAAKELEEHRNKLSELKAQKDSTNDDKEKKKQEKMALMMSKFDAVRTLLFQVLFGVQTKTDLS